MCSLVGEMPTPGPLIGEAPGHLPIRRRGGVGDPRDFSPTRDVPEAARAGHLQRETPGVASAHSPDS